MAIKTLKPLPKFIMSVGAIPTSYLESLSYPEMIIWLCHYLEETILPKINEIIINDEELDQKIDNTYSYIKENLSEIASDIINELINEGKILLSLGVDYNEENESLNFYINSIYSNEVVNELSNLTTPEDN